MLVPALFAITLHEVAHGFVAEKLGDPTARLLGRLTLNPFRHLDPIGTLALVLFGFGWARPVPVNFGNLRNPRQGMILVALAGPVTNLLVAVISALLLRVVFLYGGRFAGDMAFDHVLQPVALMIASSLFINVLLGIFNLFPLPPLDGGRVMVGLLPERYGMQLARLEPFGFVLVLVLIFYTPIWSGFLGPLIWSLVAVLSGPAAPVVHQMAGILVGR
ncbi:site-2 protease family protein [Geothermobacter hydrogeniphilus]|uniref:Site-2 protease family protein n=2 Tax=Geothermobacter hydrogeniphilus TaxID=1969733 RepID=A0A2K2HCD5_9BACT|nr:site-2 protease family protein [Geothermobacter hydrogeniphilus]